MAEGSNKEEIVVNVTGNANEQFAEMERRANRTENAVKNLAQAIGRMEEALNKKASAGGRATRATKDLGDAADKTARSKRNLGDEVEKASEKAKKATSSFDAFQQSLFGTRGKAAFIWDLAIDGFKMAMGFAQSFIERMSGVQRTMSLLATIPGSNSEEEFNYLRQTADNYGQSLKSLQDDYAKLNLAAQNTALTQTDVRRIFEQVSLATRTLHLNTQQTQLTFLAVEQMLSKGKISMEELRKQFAERIPGAMNALAREMGVPLKVMDEFITKVGASSEKVVPLLGNAIQRLYQDALPLAARALDAELNRIQTSITFFFKRVGDAGGAEGMSNLLRSINGLLQSESIAKVFANAMNTITNNIALFLSTLKPEQVDKFATTVLDFLAAFASLAVSAGKAVMFLAANLPAVGAAIGAFMGATMGAPFGPWGAAIGMIGGGVGGFALGKSMQGSAMNPMMLQEKMNKLSEYDALIKKHEADLAEFDEPLRSSSLGTLIGKGVSRLFGQKANTQGRLDTVKRLRDELWKEIEPYATQATMMQAPHEVNAPKLDGLPDVITDHKKAMEYLRKNFGLAGGKSKDELKAEQLLLRQNRAMEDLMAQVESIRSPETDKFAKIETNMEQLGIKPGHPRYLEMRNLLVELQADYNRKKQEESNRKTAATESQYSEMLNAANIEIEKFGEKYSLENLQQINDFDWATKARRMANALEVELLDQKKRWDKMAEENPLFNFGFDREKRLQELREMGQAYIEEFKRIEQEKRTIMGGAKDFLKEWNENATNYGKMTKDFMQGVTDGIVDMLLTAVKTGEFSFKKLTQFILDYIMKMLIIRAITPFMNMAVDWLGGMMSGLGGAASSVASGASNYSFSGGGGMGMTYGGLRARANGGPVWPGESFLVGERGPEVFTPRTGGYITPNESLRTGGGGTTINVQVNVESNGDTTTNAAAGYATLGAKLGEAVRAVLVDEMRPGGMLA